MSRYRDKGDAVDPARLPLLVCERLLYVDTAGFEQAMTEALESLGLSTNAARCSLFLFDAAEDLIELAYQWCADELTTTPTEPSNRGFAEPYPWLSQQLRNGETVTVADLDELPLEAASDQSSLRAHGIQSLILVPMFIGSKPLGALGVDAIADDHHWRPGDASLLESVRDLMVHALLRFQAEERASRSERQQRELIEHSQAIVYAFDRHGRYSFVSPSVTQLTGYDREDIIGRSYSEFVHPEDIDRVMPRIQSALAGNHPTPALEYRITARDGRVLWHRSVMSPVRDRHGRLESIIANALDVTELRQEAELREILLDLATRFINLPAENHDVAIDEALARIGRFVDADRAYIFRYDFDSEIARNTHEWCAEGIAPQIQNLQALSFKPMHDWVTTHQAGQPIVIRNVAVHPEQYVKEVLEAQDIKSLLSVPLNHGEECLGFVGFDSVRRHHIYSDTDIHLLKIFAEILVNLHVKHMIQLDLSTLARRLGQIVDGTHAGTWEWSPITDHLAFNQRWAEMIGYETLEELPDNSLSWTARVHPDDLPIALSALKEHLKGGINHHESELRVRHRDGSWIWLLLRGQVAARSADGKAEMVSGIALDITERKLAEERLQLAASVFSHSHEGILITDPDGNIVEVNKAFTAITGYERDEVIGRNPRFLRSGRQNKDFYAQMWQALIKDGFWAGEVWNRRKTGEFYAENLTISAVRDSHGKTIRYLGLFFDITHLKEYQQHLEQVAHFDVLTGLPNRTLLTDRLRQALVQADRSGSEVVVAYIDMDGFKAVNDQFGHAHGDECLRQIGERLRKTIRAADTVARLGGDEFVLVLSETGSLDEAARLLERVLDTVAAPYRVGSTEVSMTVSIGATVYPQALTMEADQLLRQADQAMYQAKSQGRNRLYFFDAEMEQIHTRRMNLIGQLRKALEKGELRLYYQPKIDLQADRVSGVEALIRWQHPERGLIAPADFLPALEGDELAHAIGHWVINQSLSDLAQWRRDGLAINLSFNVSAQQLLRSGFPAVLEGCLARHPDLEGSHLILEFLETGILEDLEAGREVTRACRRLGVDFALDDFGTGFSSLSHLKHLPLRQVKIDRSFVNDMLEDPEDLAIIEGVINLARAFDLEVLAEGVETTAQAAALIQLGCCHFQGYLFARPMPAGQVLNWVRQWPGAGELRQIQPISPDLTPVLFGMAELARRRSLIRQRQSETGSDDRMIRSPSRFQHWLARSNKEQSLAGAAELLDLYQALLAAQAAAEQAPSEQSSDRGDPLARFDAIARSLSGRLQALLEGDADQGSVIA